MLLSASLARVRFLASTWGRPQPPLIPTPRDLTLFSDLYGHLHTGGMQTYIKIKSFLLNVLFFSMNEYFCHVDAGKQTYVLEEQQKLCEPSFQPQLQSF